MRIVHDLFFAKPDNLQALHRNDGRRNSPVHGNCILARTIPKLALARVPGRELRSVGVFC